MDTQDTTEMTEIIIVKLQLLARMMRWCGLLGYAARVNQLANDIQDKELK
jgi:hypothetical protein